MFFHDRHQVRSLIVLAEQNDPSKPDLHGFSDGKSLGSGWMIVVVTRLRRTLHELRHPRNGV